MNDIALTTDPIERTLVIKPMSVNKAYKVKYNRQLKTREYKGYEKKILALLSDQVEQCKYPEHEELYFKMIVGSSAKLDLDNTIKPFLDILQKYFGFNDNQITFMQIEKKIVEYGLEFMTFELGIREVNDE